MCLQIQLPTQPVFTNLQANNNTRTTSVTASDTCLGPPTGEKAFARGSRPYVSQELPSMVVLQHHDPIAGHVMCAPREAG